MSLSSKVREIAETYLENVRLTDSGNVKAICPFHDGSSTDRTFSIDLKTGAWLCFNSRCNARGSFPQLLKQLGIGAKQIDRIIEDMTPAVELPRHLVVREELSREPVILPEFVLGAYSDLPESLIRKGFSPELLRRQICSTSRRSCAMNR